MAKDTWKILLFAIGILHCALGSGNVEDKTVLADKLTEPVSTETKPSEFRSTPITAENRQGYYREPPNEGGFLDFITSSAQLIGNIFSDPTARSREFSGHSLYDRSYRPPRYAVVSKYPTGREGSFHPGPKYWSFPHGPPPPRTPPPRPYPPRSERSPPPFHRYAHPPPRRHPDYKRDPYHKNSGYWTGSYSSHFKLFDDDPEEVTDTLHHQEHNLIDRRHTSSESFSVNDPKEFRASDFDNEKLLRHLITEAYKLGIPLATIDTRDKKSHLSSGPSTKSKTFLWPDQKQENAKEERKLPTTYSQRDVFDYEKPQFSAPTSFQSFQRGNAFDSFEITADDKWEQWGKLIGKSSSLERIQSNSGGNRKQYNLPTSNQNQFRYSLSQTANKNKFTPSYSQNTSPKAREQSEFTSHLKLDSFLPIASHSSFSGTSDSQANSLDSFQKAFIEAFSANNFQQSNTAAPGHQEGFVENNLRKSFTASELQPFFPTYNAEVRSTDKKHNVGNVVDALKIVVDALENTHSEEKIYISKTSPRPQTSINFKFSAPDTKSDNFGSEWTPIF